MPEPVTEVLPVAGCFDHRAGRAVHVGQVGARGQGVPAGSLGVPDQLVQVPLPACGCTDRDGAGHVGVVAAVARAEVEGEQVAGDQRALARAVVRQGAVGAGGGDGVERRRLRAEVAHPVLQQAGHLPLGQAGAQHRQQVRQGPVTDGAGGPQQVQLAGVLDPAKALHQLTDLHQLGGGLGRDHRRDVAVLGDAEVVRLEPEPDPAAPDGPLGQRDRAGTGDQHLDVGGLLGALLGIAEVGAQHRCPRFARRGGRDQQRRVAAGETGQVADVDQAGHQQGVHLLGGQQGGQPLTSGHRAGLGGPGLGRHRRPPAQCAGVGVTGDTAAATARSASS